MTERHVCECCGVREADTSLSSLSAKLTPSYVGLVGARFANACWNECANSEMFAARIRKHREKLASPLLIADPVPDAPNYRITATITCPTRSRDGLKCCHAIDHPGHHEEHADGDRIGWVKVTSRLVEFGIHSTDTPKVIYGNLRTAIAASLPTPITTQAQADSLFGAGSAVAGIAGAAAESLESDESWCARQLAEYTGLPAHCVRKTRFGIDVTLDNGARDGLMFRVDLEHVQARDMAWFQAELAKCALWPRAVVGEAKTAKFYGTQPDPLPDTLPTGTQGIAAKAEERMVLREWHGRACYKRESNQQGAPWAWPEQIVWLAVPIQETKLTGHGVIAAQQDCQHRFDQEQRRCLRCGLGEKEYEEIEAAKLKASSPAAPTPTFCASGIGCKAPATHGLFCVYCAWWDSHGSEFDTRGAMDRDERNVAAHARMARADRLERPRATADSRAFAKGHPWECGGEQEP